jgi:hypothetical protein
VEDRIVGKSLIARIGVEGGGADIYGSREGGVWSFWTEGTSMDLDENDDEVWRSWSSQPVARLEDVLPKDWPLFHPIEIHPDLVASFRAAYEPARARLGSEMRVHQTEHTHGAWVSVLCPDGDQCEDRPA